MLLGQAAGVPLTHVAYKGGAPAAQDLIGGQIPLMVDTASETIEHHKAGKVRILAVTGEQRRNRALPDVPTLKELGINTHGRRLLRPVRPGRHGGGRGGAHRPRGGRRAEGARHPGEDLRLRPGAQPRARPQLAVTQAAHLKKWETPIKASGFKAE